MKKNNKQYVKKIKPGADQSLKKIFASIGTPEQQDFKPDPFQLRAVEIIASQDCLVTAPTGSGKTWIATQTIARILKKGGRSWYASPLKALTNSKYQEFIQLFGQDQVGILTGDRKENPDAAIVIGTTEILRNQLYDAMQGGFDLKADLVILDEAHYLGESDRGVVWEEVMIYLPPRIDLLLLSATIGNADRLAAWLTSIRGRECAVVNTVKRPVQMYPLFFHPSGKLMPLVENPKNKTAKLFKPVHEYVKNKNQLLLGPPRKLAPVGDILRVLKKYNLTPVIFFMKSRSDCDNALGLCSHNILSPLKQEQLAIRIKELALNNPHLQQHRNLWTLEHLAVGSHHSGHLPLWKLFVETLMNERLLDAVFATSTVAAGVNFPARTVVFLNSDRFNGRDFMSLNATEFHQMTGRAGRRGMDKIGFALMIPGKYSNIKLFAKLVNAQPEPVLSQIRINFSMTLNLLLSHTAEEVRDLLEKSYAAFLLKKKHGHLWRIFQKHLNFLKAADYANSDDRLTDEGIWASQLRVDQPLMIAEGLRHGVLPVHNPVLTAAIMASFVNERMDDEKLNQSTVPQNLLDCFENLRDGLRALTIKMFKHGFEPARLFISPALIMHRWATGHDWNDVLTHSNIQEGDLAMLILRTADHLRHLCLLSRVFPQSAAAAAQAIELIMRDPVDTNL